MKIGANGQDIGLTDKHGDQISIGDEVRITFSNGNTKPCRIWYFAPELLARDLTGIGSFKLIDWGHGIQVKEFEITKKWNWKT